jgi:hypothetical protein
MCKNISMVAEREKHLQNSIKELSHEMDWAFDWKRPAALFQMFLFFLTKLYIFLVVNVKRGWLNNVFEKCFLVSYWSARFEIFVSHQTSFPIR